MSLSRRDFALLTVAGLAGAAAKPAFADVSLAAIVAEGGSADERIEDTRPALDLAITQGCDFIQVNLVPTKEGALVARRGNELSASTDVAARPDFADRKTSRTIDGAELTGWFAEDFTLPELQTLFCREADPAMRPQNVRLGGKEPILTIGDVLQVARNGCIRTARTVGVCARLSYSGYFEGQGLDVVGRLASELTTAGYVSPASAIWVQSGDPDALKTFAPTPRRSVRIRTCCSTRRPPPFPRPPPWRWTPTTPGCRCSLAPFVRRTSSCRQRCAMATGARRRSPTSMATPTSCSWRSSPTRWMASAPT